MSVQTANSQFSFHLPSLSYIDAKWEEPSLRTPAAAERPARKSGLNAWLLRRIDTVLTWRRDRQAAAELASMTDYQLLDIGISRADLARAFNPAFNQDLRQRGTNG